MESDVNATNVITELNTLPNNNYKIYNDGLIREPYEQLQLPEIPQEEVSIGVFTSGLGYNFRRSLFFNGCELGSGPK